MSIYLKLRESYEGGMRIACIFHLEVRIMYTQTEPLLQQIAVIYVDGEPIYGSLAVPENAAGVVLFSHGSGGRHNPRRQAVARVLQNAGIGTLLFDLLSDEESADQMKLFDINLLVHRLIAATTWTRSQADARGLPIAYFGASAVAAAAVIAATERELRIAAVVARGGRLDLARDYLPLVTAPTLLIVGSEDQQALKLNGDALNLMQCEKHLEVVKGATQWFSEPGVLMEAAHLAADWFNRHLRRAKQPDARFD